MSSFQDKISKKILNRLHKKCVKAKVCGGSGDMCARERDRERGREGGMETERQTDSEYNSLSPGMTL